MIHPPLFYTLSFVAVLCAVLVVSARNIFHAGLFLIGSFLAVAGIYLTLQNYFLAAAQALVYAGAIAVLILFGIMLTQQHHKEEEPGRWFFKILSALLCIVLSLALIKTYEKLPQGYFYPVEGLLEEMGKALMQTYVLPFEIISILLLVALIGAFAIAREKEEL